MNTIYKLFIVTGLFAVTLFSANAQTTNTGYFMKSQHSRTTFNPALRPEQGYLGFPLLSNVYADIRTNTLNLDHFIFPGSGKSQTFLHKDISFDKFMENISENNYTNIDIAYTLFALGFYSGESFWTIDWNVKAHTDLNIPSEVFRFAKKGFSKDNPSYYDMKDIRGRATGYSEIGVGYSRPFLDNTLIVGLKGKFLVGFGNMDFHIKQLSLDAGMDRWTMQSHATLEGSAPGLTPKYDDEGNFEGIDISENPEIAGYGFGFDIGATYKLTAIADLIDNKTFSDIVERLTFSAALTDIGAISWAKKNNMYLATNPMKKTITGDYDISFEDEGNGTSFEDQIEAIGDTITNALNLTEDPSKSGGRSTSLRMNMNLGLEYEILKDKLSAGILSSTYFNESHNVTEFTMAGAYKPVSWFEVGLSYSFVHSKFNTFGLALNLVPSKGMNLFLASDYVVPHINSDFIPTTSKALNVQFGISFPLGAKR